MRVYTDSYNFLNEKQSADNIRKQAEDYERKGEYVDAKRYYFEAAKKYKYVAEQIRSLGYVEMLYNTIVYRVEDLNMEYEYCTMQVKAITQLQFGIIL